MMNDSQMKEMINRLYWKREPDSIKSDFGRTLIVGGSSLYPFAPVISSHFAVLSGNGYTYLSVTDEIKQLVCKRLPLTVVFAKPLFEYDNLDSFDCILFGNGIENNQDSKDKLAHIMKKYRGTLVIDATGLAIYDNACKEVDEVSCKNIILTPHLGEAASLFKTRIKTREPKDFLEYAKEFSIQNKCYILLKSSSSILVSPNKNIAFSSYESCAGLSKPGSGDGLSGLIAGFLSYGTKYYSVTELMMLADHLIHVAAKKVANKVSPGNMDVLATIPEIGEIIAQSR